MGTMRILDQTGDTVITWSVEQAATLERAEAVFEQMLAAKKMAFARPEGGQADDAERIYAFEPNCEEIIWVRPIQGG
jgi:hypothetical protein